MNLCKVVVLVLLIFVNQKTSAQIFPAKNYPKGYFIWPVKATPALAANFGELRPNHYHMGLDCKTEKKQNLPVIAAADGYIAKVKIEPWGFGRAIYINHPNGLTTLYAHLNDFYPALENYIKEQQYKLKSWRVFLEIPDSLFRIKKGDFIAYSGNTGGSQGPHLHFEVRDTKTDKVLNPLLFGFGITDNVAPDVLRLAIYDRCLSTYEQTPRYIPLKKVNGVYQANLNLLNTDKVSFAITAYDRYTGSTNQNGIYEADLFDNDTPVIGFQLDSISYDETRYLNAHIDHKIKGSGGPYLQHISKLPGYPTGVYKMIKGDGVINLEDDSIHHIKIIVKDANGNASVVKIDVQRKLAKLFSKADSLLHLQKKLFVPGFVNIYENSNLRFYLSEGSLYDSIRFRYNEVIPNTGNPIYQLHSATVPVHNYFPVSIKANVLQPNKMVMNRMFNGKDDFKKTIFQNGWFTSSFRDFGNFQLLEDTTPPTITPIGIKDGANCSKQTSIKFVVVDNTEDVEFTAMLDGQWLRFSNDKGKTFVYTFDEKCAPGAHELKIVAKDMVGNVNEKTYKFIR
ncbi:MAG: M23 family metallopeptidase [Chitinophagaceae bacterium]|nr:M23 family metallopeptidase [Chitinophagaceae bacterium]